MLLQNPMLEVLPRCPSDLAPVPHQLLAPPLQGYLKLTVEHQKQTYMATLCLVGLVIYMKHTGNSLGWQSEVALEISTALSAQWSSLKWVEQWIYTGGTVQRYPAISLTETMACTVAMVMAPPTRIFTGKVRRPGNVGTTRICFVRGLILILNFKAWL